MKKLSIFILLLTKVFFFSYSQIKNINEKYEKEVNGTRVNKYFIHAEKQTIDSLEDFKSIQVLCDTLYSFHTTDTWPSGLAWDGINFWVGGTDYPIINKVSPTGVVLSSIPNPNTSTNYYGGGLDYDGVDLWCVVEEANMVYRLNTSNGAVKRQFSLPTQSNSNGWGIAYDGKNMWYSQYLPPILYKIDTSNGQPISSYNLAVNIISIHVINGKLYGINTNMYPLKWLYQIDMSNGSIIDSVEWCIPYPLGLAWDGSNLWNVSSKISYGGNQRVYKIGNSILNDVDEVLKESYNSIVYPNPVIDNFEMEIDANSKIDIYNLQGQILRHLVSPINHILINISDFPIGIYFVQVTSIRCTNTYKLLKQ